MPKLRLLQGDQPSDLLFTLVNSPSLHLFGDNDNLFHCVCQYQSPCAGGGHSCEAAEQRLELHAPHK